MKTVIVSTICLAIASILGLVLINSYGEWQETRLQLEQKMARAGSCDYQLIDRSIQLYSCKLDGRRCYILAGNRSGIWCEAR